MTPRRIAIITGAGSGIGRAASLALAKTGFVVALAGRRADMLEETSQAIGATGGASLIVPTDVSDPASVHALFAKVRESSNHGPVLSRCAADWEQTFG
jgi:NAD(P)-dependent dehydrogenase (short-subunit alcohol dehydrogenase family)